MKQQGNRYFAAIIVFALCSALLWHNKQALSFFFREPELTEAFTEWSLRTSENGVQVFEKNQQKSGGTILPSFISQNDSRIAAINDEKTAIFVMNKNNELLFSIDAKIGAKIEMGLHAFYSAAFGAQNTLYVADVCLNGAGELNSERVLKYSASGRFLGEICKYVSENDSTVGIRNKIMDIVYDASEKTLYVMRLAKNGVYIDFFNTDESGKETKTGQSFIYFAQSLFAIDTIFLNAAKKTAFVRSHAGAITKYNISVPIAVRTDEVFETVSDLNKLNTRGKNYAINYSKDSALTLKLRLLFGVFVFAICLAVALFFVALRFIFRSLPRNRYAGTFLLAAVCVLSSALISSALIRAQLDTHIQNGIYKRMENALAATAGALSSYAALSSNASSASAQHTFAAAFFDALNQDGEKLRLSFDNTMTTDGSDKTVDAEGVWLTVKSGNLQSAFCLSRTHERTQKIIFDAVKTTVVFSFGIIIFCLLCAKLLKRKHGDGNYSYYIALAEDSRRKSLKTFTGIFFGAALLVTFAATALPNIVGVAIVPPLGAVCVWLIFALFLIIASARNGISEKIYWNIVAGFCIIFSSLFSSVLVLHNMNDAFSGFLEFADADAVSVGAYKNTLVQIALIILSCTITLFLIFSELLLIAKTYQKTKSASSETFHPELLRIAVFLLFVVCNLASPILPLHAARFYTPIFGLPYELVITFPFIADMLCGAVVLLALPFILQKYGVHKISITAAIALALGNIFCYFSKDIISLTLSYALIGFASGALFLIINTVIGSQKKVTEINVGFAHFNASYLAGVNVGAISGAILAQFFDYRIVFLCGALLCLFLVFVFVFSIRKKMQIYDVMRHDKHAAFALTPALVATLIFLLFPYMLSSNFVTYFMPIFAASNSLHESNIGQLFLLHGIFAILFGTIFCKWFSAHVPLKLTLCVSFTMISAAIWLFSMNISVKMLIIAIVIMAFANILFPTHAQTFYAILYRGSALPPVTALSIYCAVESLAFAAGPTIFSYIFALQNRFGTDGIARGLKIYSVASFLCVFLFLLVPPLYTRMRGIDSHKGDEQDDCVLPQEGTLEEGEPRKYAN